MNAPTLTLIFPFFTLTLAACSSGFEENQTQDESSTSNGTSGFDFESSSSYFTSDEHLESSTSELSFTSRRKYVGRLHIQLNILDGAAFIVGSNFETIFAKAQGSSCIPENGYYNCDLELSYGEYIIGFEEVAGYTTPDPQGIELDSPESDKVIGDYVLTK